MAGPAAMAQEVDVQLELLPAGRQAQHLVVKLLERRAGAEEPEPCPHARDVGVHRDVALAEREQQDTRGGLAADARQRGQPCPALFDARVRQPAEVVAVELPQDRLDAGGLDLRDAAGADRRLHLGVRRVPDRLPAPEALAQAQEGAGAVASARGLREDGEDQLVERPAVRRGDRTAVHGAEAVPDAANARARWVGHAVRTVARPRGERRYPDAG